MDQYVTLVLLKFSIFLASIHVEDLESLRDCICAVVMRFVSYFFAGDQPRAVVITHLPTVILVSPSFKVGYTVFKSYRSLLTKLATSMCSVIAIDCHSYQQLKKYLPTFESYTIDLRRKGQLSEG
jgi:hypothetical protein